MESVCKTEHNSQNFVFIESESVGVVRKSGVQESEDLARQLLQTLIKTNLEKLFNLYVLIPLPEKGKYYFFPLDFSFFPFFLLLLLIQVPPFSPFAHLYPSPAVFPLSPHCCVYG